MKTKHDEVKVAERYLQEAVKAGYYPADVIKRLYNDVQNARKRAARKAR